MTWRREFKLISFELTTDYIAVQIPDEGPVHIERVDGVGLFDVKCFEDREEVEGYRGGHAIRFESGELVPIVEHRQSDDTRETYIEKRTALHSFVGLLASKGREIINNTGEPLPELVGSISEPGGRVDNSSSAVML